MNKGRIDIKKGKNPRLIQLLTNDMPPLTIAGIYKNISAVEILQRCKLQSY